jgi:hypothetical protein
MQPATAMRSVRLFAPPEAGAWLFGRRIDLLVFGGSALLAFALLALGQALGIADGDAPAWIWLLCIVGVDVAHVWSTAFRVYLDPAELRARPWLYFGLPVVCYALCVAAHAVSPAFFWRALAYVAVYHFVRQQYGWVALYRRRAGEHGAFDRALDTATIYAATIYPLLWWHAHLPRGFAWFVQGDFVRGLAAPFAEALLPCYWGLLAAFCARQLQLRVSGRAVNQGKVLIVLTTWAAWHVGIMVYDSDYAFTVTNVLIHGIPYFALTYRYARVRAGGGDAGCMLPAIVARGAWAFFALLVLVAALEEGLWDGLVWREQEWARAPGIQLGSVLLTFVVPLLALPQALHYALDGFVWRVRDNPLLARELAPGGSGATQAARGR